MSMKNRIIDILANPIEGVGRDIILPRREAEIIAEKLVNALGDIAYICDEKACDGCGGVVRDCYHTTDIRHAKNFVELPGGKFIEHSEVMPFKDRKEARDE